MAFQLELVLRFDYGISIPWVTRLQPGMGSAPFPGPIRSWSGRCAVAGQGHDHRRRFRRAPGRAHSFSLSHAPSHLKPPAAPDADAELTKAEAHWRRWSDRTTYRGRWHAQVRRSLLTLKAMTYSPTGGIVAAVTTSLPEWIGGVRNWDYRFCWPRYSELHFARSD